MESEVIRITWWKRLLSFLLYFGAVALRTLNRLFVRSHPDRVLFLEPVGFGDVITSEPLIRELAASHYEVLIASRPQWEPLIEPRPKQKWFNVWFPWGSHDESVKYDFRNYLKREFWGPILAVRKAAKGSIGMDPRGDIRGVLFLYLVGCKRVIALSNYMGSNSFIPPWVAEIVPFKNNPRWQLNLEFLQRLNPQFIPEKTTPPLLKHLISRKPEKRIAFIPIAPWRGKWWEPERWIALAETFAGQGFAIVGLYGPGQEAFAQAQLPGIKIIECASVEDWALQLNKCDLVVSVDSGPMHFADALRIPLVALFGQGFLPLWAPSAPTSTVLTNRGEDFVVCHGIDANIELGRKCMQRITVEEVMAAARDLLKQVNQIQNPN
jgi:ADP-heptose:LPS heptosyltransferase